MRCLASQLLVLLPSGHSLFRVFGVFFPGGYYFLAFITHTCTFYLKGPETGLTGVLQTLRVRKCPVSDLAPALLLPSQHPGKTAPQLSHRGWRLQNHRAMDPEPGATGF